MRKGWTLPVLAAALTAGLAPSPAPLAGDPRPIVDAYRKIIVLLDDGGAPDENARQRREVVARYVFQENEARLSALGEALGTDAARVAAFLDVLEKDEGLHDADKLVFRDFLDDLAARLQEAPAGAPKALLARVAEDQDALRRIQALYQKELEKIFGRIETRGMPVRREAWETYLAFVRTRVNVEAVLAEYREVADSVPQTRGGGAPAEGSGETSGSRLPAKTLLLTFDDGPHARHTARILDILKQRGIKAVFFAVGQNLGTVKKDDQVQPTAASAATRALVEAGYPLANHSFSHSFLPKLSADALKNEIELTNRMIKEVAQTSSVLFRPPYGARNAAVSEAVAAHGMRSVLWNVDSRDWADPVPLSIADRVLKEVEKEKHGIVLFHDIHARTVEALPALLDALQERGYQFLTWDGSQFVVEDHGRGGPAVAETPPATASFYNDSWAVVVGIDKYKSWPRLAYAVNDARGMKELLISKYHFKPENVFLLLDEDATREKILNVLGDKLADPARVKKDDRVLVFFAGHGVTRRLPSGKSLGYLVPVDADQASYQSQAISMTNFQDVSEAIPAKHILFVTDACYSGVALTRGGGTSSGLSYLREVTRRAVRQVLTAGGADQEVADGGPSGHSIFTWALMQGLEGKADLSGDGFITASELAAYVGPTVSSLSRQTPAFGNLVGSEGGEFVFELKHESEFLSEESGQLDQQAIALNAELEKVRARLAEKRSRNEELQKELKAGAAQLNDRGTQAFREKRYQDALKDFEESARLNPRSALFANNVGFAYYKLGRMDDAVRWFEKTLEIDPQRAVANVNLGDALVVLGRRDDARKAYQRYLELQPATRSADYARRKLEELAAPPPSPQP